LLRGGSRRDHQYADTRATNVHRPHEFSLPDSFRQTVLFASIGTEFNAGRLPIEWGTTEPNL
jgi:hypothetical protein